MARIEAITMPRWGMTMTEGTVADWLVAEGDRVTAEDEVVEIETTKITNVMEAGRAGVVRKIVAHEGATVPVGALIAVVADEAASEEEIAAFVEARAAAGPAQAEAAPEPPRTVDAAGRAINVVSRGGGAGLPAVLVHGFGGDLDNFLFNMEALGEARPVHGIDLPAHGNSSPDAGAGDLSTLAGVLAATLDALGIARAHLVGHSLGGAVATRLAADAPERVASLAVIAPAGFGPEIGADYVPEFLAADRRKAVKAVLGKLFAAGEEAVTKEMVAAVQHARRVDGAKAGLEAIAAAVFPGGRQAESVREVYAGLTVPRLAIWGETDRIVPPRDAEGLPGAVEILKGAGHMPHMEAAASVNRLLAAHLSAAEA